VTVAAQKIFFNPGFSPFLESDKRSALTVGDVESTAPRNVDAVPD